MGEAVRLRLALLPTTVQRRPVLLSDGRANVPGAEMAAALAAASGVELDTVSLPARSGDEAWLDAIDVPTLLYEGEEFSVVVHVQSAVEQRALLRLLAGRTGSLRTCSPNTLVVEEAVWLHPGLNSLRTCSPLFSDNLSAGEAGFSTFTAQLVPEKDISYQNNVLGAFALVHGPPRVLVVARAEYEDEDSGQMVDSESEFDAARLVLALERANMFAW